MLADCFKRSLGCVLSAPELCLAWPGGNLVAAELAQRLEASCRVERAGLGIALVDVAEETLQLTNLLIPDVVPDFEDREVGPEPSLGATVTAQSASYPPVLAQPTHADVDDIVIVVLRAAIADPSVEYIDAAKTAGNLEHALLRNVLGTLSDQAQWALRHSSLEVGTQPNATPLSRERREPQ